METLIPKNIAIRFVYTVSLVEIPGIPNRRGCPDGFSIQNNVDILAKQTFYNFCMSKDEINKEKEIPGRLKIIFHKSAAEKNLLRCNIFPFELFQRHSN